MRQETPRGGALTGTVTDMKTGEPICGALIKLASPACPGIVETATNLDGEFMVPFLPAPGEYDIVIIALGYQPLSDAVAVRVGETTAEKFGLDLAAEGTPTAPEPPPVQDKGIYVALAEEYEERLGLAIQFCAKDEMARCLVDESLNGLKGMAGLVGPAYMPMFVARAAGQRFTQIAAELEAALQQDCKRRGSGEEVNLKS